MRRGLVLTVIAAMFMANVAPAMAQMKPPRIVQQQRIKAPKAPKPVIKIIPPSQAAIRAGQMNPGAKLVGIKRAGNGYVATMRKGNQVIRVQVPGT